MIFYTIIVLKHRLAAKRLLVLYNFLLAKALALDITMAVFGLPFALLVNNYASSMWIITWCFL